MFIEKIKLVSVTNKTVVLFDVMSLFTNIPLTEVIDIATNLFSENSPDKNLLSVSSENVLE